VTYATEFPDFDLDVAIPPGWADISWHNDVCPSWATGTGWKVFVDYRGEADREFPYMPRFTIVHDPEMHPDAKDYAVRTDSWDRVLDFTGA
jgi:hypothetical protein